MDQKKVAAMSRADAGALIAFSVIGALIAVGALVGAVIRIAEMLGSGPITVTAQVIDTEVELANGASASVDTATLSVDALPGFARAAGIAQQASLSVAVVVIVICLLLLSRQVMRGRLFSRSNTVLVAIAGIAGALAAAAVPFLGAIVADGALQESTGAGELVFTLEPVTFWLGMFALAIILTAFSVGERLQRDTEGLV